MISNIVRNHMDVVLSIDPGVFGKMFSAAVNIIRKVENFVLKWNGKFCVKVECHFGKVNVASSQCDSYKEILYQRNWILPPLEISSAKFQLV